MINRKLVVSIILIGIAITIVGCSNEIDSEEVTTLSSNIEGTCTEIQQFTSDISLW